MYKLSLALLCWAQATTAVHVYGFFWNSSTCNILIDSGCPLERLEESTTQVDNTFSEEVDSLALHNEYTGKAAETLAETYATTMARQLRLEKSSQKIFIQAFMDEKKYTGAAAYFMALYHYDCQKGKAKAVALYPELDADTCMAILLYAPAKWLAKFVKEQAEANAIWPTAKAMPGEACVSLQDKRKQEATAFFPMDVNRCLAKAKNTSSFDLLQSLHDLKEFAGKEHQEAALAKFIAVFRAFYYGEDNTASVQAAFRARLANLQDTLFTQLPSIELFKPLERLGKNHLRLQWLVEFGRAKQYFNGSPLWVECDHDSAAVEKNDELYFKCFNLPEKLTKESLAKLAAIFADERKELLLGVDQPNRMLADVIVHLPPVNDAYKAELALLNDMEELAPIFLQHFLRRHIADICNAFETKGLAPSLSDEAYSRVLATCLKHKGLSLKDFFKE